MIWGFSFASSPHNPNMSTFAAVFDLPSRYKTIGVLNRGKKIPIVAAMSGWSHPESETIQVAGKTWTGEVSLLCAATGFPLTPHSHDRESTGQYHACHAEKQLVAYFVDQHPPYRAVREDIRRRLWPVISELMEIEPPVSVKRAMVMVNRPVCDDCSRFVEHINQVLGLEISVVSSLL